MLALFTLSNSMNLPEPDILQARMGTSFFWIFIILGFLESCSPEHRPADYDPSFAPKYARGFSVVRQGNVKWVTVAPADSKVKDKATYVLLPYGQPLPDNVGEALVVRTPIKSIVCTSTTHIPLLDYLQLTDRLIGFPTTAYISSKKMRARIDSGKVADLGVDKQMNLELLMTLRPDVVMSYSFGDNLGQFSKIQQLGIPVINNSEYLESHPLGRAEWIKFMALFFDREKEADSIFTTIESEYLKTKKKALENSSRPSVLSGIVYGDTWFLPGGKNYAAQLFSDAGYLYLWEEDPSTGFLQLSFESVYAQAREADFWIGVGSFETLSELAQNDKRYKLFKAFQQSQVYSYNARMGEGGGSEFLELGYLRPDIILRDLVKIAHPDLMPDHTLYFYKQLP